jgi:hypothetical protein
MLDFAPWDSMLQAYVNDQGQVNYFRWQQDAKITLATWLDSLRPVAVTQLLPEEHLALLLNLYNALVIQQVLARYPINSIRPSILGLPNWVGFLRFFSRPVYSLNGEALSLNQLEHQTLRPIFQEPRIHFALVCAAVGCPILRNEAYLPDIVEAQLETDAQRFINNPDKVRYDEESDTLYCSKIFKWYEKDFLQAAPSIPAYIAQYLPKVPKTAVVRHLPYDWSLNQRFSP